MSGLNLQNFFGNIYLSGINNIFLDPALDGGGLHQVFNGGLLNVHTDFNTHLVEKTWRRVLNILIFLNHNWRVISIPYRIIKSNRISS